MNFLFILTNMGQKLHFFLVFIIILLLNGCKSDSCTEAPDVSDIHVDVNIERLDKSFSTVSSKAELSKLLDEHKAVKNLVLHADQYPNDSLLVRQFYRLLSDPNIDSLFMEVDKTFGDLSEIKAEFDRAFSYVKYYYPDAKIPKITAVVTGLAHDLYISDSLIVIGLDYFLGPQAKYIPLDQPAYILKRYQKSYIVPQIMMLYASKYIKSDYQDQTALAEMVFYGKAFEFAKNMLPCSPDSLLTGYTEKEMNEVDKYENVIWASIIENEYLYENSHEAKQKILGERPHTFEISQNCPGRIGRWVGWQIVKAYRDQNPDVSLPELMRNKDAKEIFAQSKYKPIK